MVSFAGSVSLQRSARGMGSLVSDLEVVALGLLNPIAQGSSAVRAKPEGTERVEGTDSDLVWASA